MAPIDAQGASAMESVLMFIPPGHAKAVRSAFYNTVALAIFGIVTVVAGSVYLYVLQPYLRPLLWAGLCGSVLYPLKERVAVALKSWISVVQNSRKPAVVEVAFVPFVFIDSAYEFCRRMLTCHCRTLLATTFGFLICLAVYYWAPMELGRIFNDTQEMLLPLTTRMTTFSIYLAFSALLAYYLVVLILPASQLHPSGTFWKIAVPFGCILSWVFICFNLMLHWLSQPRVFVYHICVASLLWVLPLTVGFWKERLGCAFLSSSGSKSEPSLREELKQIPFRPAKGDLRQRAILANARAKTMAELNTINDNAATVRRRTLQWSMSEDHHGNRRFASGSTPDVRTDRNRVPLFTSTPRVRSVSESFESASGNCPDVPEEDLGQKDTPQKQQVPPLLVVDPPPVEAKEARSNSLDLPSMADASGRSFSRPRAYSDSCGRTIYASARSMRNCTMNRTRLAEFAAQSPGESEGNVYLVSLIWMWILMELWTYPKLFQLLPIPVIYLIFKHTWLFLCNSKRLGACSTAVMHRLEAKKKLLVPFPIPVLYRWFLRGERAVISVFSEYVDSVASICIISAGIILSGLALIFISIQIYQEGVLLVSLSGQALNSTIVGTFIGSGEMAKLMHQSTDSIHHYGHVLVSSAVRHISGDLEEAKLQEVEHQLLEVWNKFYIEYNKYVAREVRQREIMEFSEPEPLVDPACSGVHKMVSIGVQTSPDPGEFSWISLSNAMKLMPGSMPKVNTTILTQFVKNNVDLMQSIASIIASNLYLAVGGLTALLSLLAGGGTAVLNFVLSWLIFCTTLFYLLKSSSSMYKPVDFLASLTFQSTAKFAMAFDRAISDVFLVSFKIALFYGLWTWIMHDFFDVKLVFIPSAVASILAVVPLFGSYLVCIPGAVELWAVQNRSTAAILFFLAHLIPPYFVNDAFYRDIRGDSHPYLTSLAVMGGVLCLGVEGAIFGPVLLCLLLIVYQTFKTSVQETPLLRMLSGETSGFTPAPANTPEISRPSN